MAQRKAKISERLIKPPMVLLLETITIYDAEEIKKKVKDCRYCGLLWAERLKWILSIFTDALVYISYFHLLQRSNIFRKAYICTLYFGVRNFREHQLSCEGNSRIISLKTVFFAYIKFCESRLLSLSLNYYFEVSMIENTIDVVVLWTFDLLCLTKL